jgi:hypothetical protein
MTVTTLVATSHSPVMSSSTCARSRRNRGPFGVERHRSDSGTLAR